MATLAQYFRDEGTQQGLQQGLQQGMEKERLEIAKNMLKRKLSISVISQVTDLSEKELQSLRLKIAKEQI